MKVWVDCTAAAHPLVLRPIIERLQARGRRGLRHRPRVRADAGDPRAAGDALHRRSAATAAPRRWARAGAGGPLGAARRARLGAAAATSRSPTARSTWPSSRPSSASPRCRCRTTSSPACSARSPSASRRRVLVPDTIPLERLRRIGAPRRSKLVRYPGPQGGVLPRRLRARRGGPRRARPRPREGAGRRPPAAGDLRVPRPQRPLRPRRSSRLAGQRGGAGGGHPPHRARRPPRRGRLGRRQPDRPRAGDRRPEPDRLRRPRGQRRRDDEPRGRRPRAPPSTRPSAGRMGGVDEALIAEGRLRVLERPGRAASCASATAPRRRAAARATRSCWSRRALGAVASVE